jgi:hypothetical protein
VPRLDFAYSHGRDQSAASTESESHGGFDNDPVTMNHVLERILGRPPEPAFTERNLDY